MNARFLRAAIATGIAFLAMDTTANGVDLSPGKWPERERARLEQLESTPWPAEARTVVGSSGLVAATLSPVATHVGMQTLRGGGTAADAAIATALTQIATNLGSIISYAGVLQLEYYDAKTGQVTSLDAGWGAYRNETDPLTIPTLDLSDLVPGSAVVAGPQGRKTLVPGFMAGIEAMHRRFGKLPFNDLFQPAIWYSSHGLRVTPLLSYYFSSRQKSLSRTASGRKFLQQAGGDLPEIGDVFVQPEVARLLRDVAKHGAQAMYTGSWSREYIAAVRSEGGKVTADDLENYAVTWEKPLSTQFDGAEVFGPGERNPSGCTTLEMLNLLNASGVARLGPYWTDSHVLALHAQALQLATFGHYARQVFAFEEAHRLAHDCVHRTSPAYASIVAPALPELSGYGAAGSEGHHSAAVVVVDRWGNVAALVHSINAEIWGDTGIVAGGVPVAGAAGLYQQRLAALKPGEHLPSDMAPLIVLKGGKPVMAVAAVGSSLVPETVRVVTTVPYGADSLRKVMASPPLLLNFEAQQNANPLAPRPLLTPGGAYTPQIVDQLVTSGIAVKSVPVERVRAIRGTAAAAVIDPASGIAHAVEAPNVVVFADADP
ncbi:MAG TPA: gamma-glutamyltransferase [Steroidobacteraceae bacterium]|jgi:gamma-glutamyltranspeptidase/glutathione hydrolase